VLLIIFIPFVRGPLFCGSCCRWRKIILIILKDLGTNPPQKREGNQSTNIVLGNVGTWDTVLKNSIQKFDYNPVINKPS
jgi:hypothetical protein